MEVVVGLGVLDVVVGASLLEVVAVVGFGVLVDGGVVDVSAGGGITDREIVAPHSARGVPLGQQPASVQ